LETRLEILDRNLWNSFRSLFTDIDDLSAEMKDRVAEIDREAQNAFREIFSAAENAQGLSDDAMMLSDEAAAGVRELIHQVEQIRRDDRELHARMLAALEALQVEDPVEAGIKARVREVMEWKRQSHPALSLDELANETAQLFPDLPIGYVHGVTWGSEGSLRTVVL
jgi:hypothetical protein